MKKNKERKKLKDSNLFKVAKEKFPDILGKGIEIFGDLSGRESIENLGEWIQDKVNPSPIDKIELDKARELDIKQEQMYLDFLKNEDDNTTKRWESDNQQDLKFPRLIRPSVIAYSWLLLTFLAIADYFKIVIDSADRIISLIELVNLAYFGSRGYEKIIKYKNKNK